MCRCIVVYFSRSLLFHFIFTTVCLWPKFITLRCYTVFPLAKHLCLVRDPTFHYVPLRAPMCPYMPLCATMCPMCHYMPLHATMYPYEPLQATTCPYETLYYLCATMSHYMPLQITMCPYKPPHATICPTNHYIPLQATMCPYKPLCASTCPYKPLHAPMCPFMPLSSFKYSNLIGGFPSLHSKCNIPTNHNTYKLGLIIIKLPNAPLHLFPEYYVPLEVINKLTLKRASNKTVRMIFEN